MKTLAYCRLGLTALFATFAVAQVAQATTYPVTFNYLTESATVASPLTGGDTLFLDTLVTTETGMLDQAITFTVGPTVGSFSAVAAWAVDTAAGAGPRLTGVNIDLLDSLNNVVASDTFLGILGGFAHSTFTGSIGPGMYKLVATGTGVRTSSLDVSMTFANAVPEPETYAMMLAGLALLGVAMRRKLK
ncbi:MAG: PEPxxWA-CTERM sorting domain-containing protein [Betaproteobacteria bacterium]